ncbi:MAG: DUF819 family protein [Alphaproteobacteria bacterium]|nr:DUF819 family protein [Alphaproteobacteria bacterium]
MTSAILPEHHIILLFILIGCAYLGLLSEKVPYLSRISGVFVTMFLASLLSNTQIIPHEAPIYDIVWQYFILLSIPFILMRAHLKTIISQSGPTFTAFIIGAIGTIIGSILAFLLISIGEETWKIVSMFCASYIGGSINYVATSKVLDLQNQNLFFAGNAADNVVMACYFSILGIMSSHPFFLRLFKNKNKIFPTPSLIMPVTSSLSLKDLLLTLFISTGIYSLSFLIGKFINVKGTEILIVTLLVIFLVNSYPRFVKKLIPYEIIGFMLLHIFFAVIGASANVVLAIQVAPKIILIAFVIVFVHLLWLIFWGRWLKIGLRELIIASNANIGGPATAAAMATSKQWPDLVVPGILCGTFGYAIATFIGSMLKYVLEIF